MIGRVTDFILGREPVATATGLAGGVTALVGVLAAFDVWRPTPEQIAAIGALVAWLAGWAARRAVTPVGRVAMPREAPSPFDPLDTAEGDSRLRGNVVVGFLVLIVGVILVMALAFGVCVDDDDADAMSIAARSHDDDYGYDEDERSPGSGDCAGAENCSDDDALVDADEIIICLRPDSCNFG